MACLLGEQACGERRRFNFVAGRKSSLKVAHERCGPSRPLVARLGAKHENGEVVLSECSATGPPASGFDAWDGPLKVRFQAAQVEVLLHGSVVGEPVQFAGGGV